MIRLLITVLLFMSSAAMAAEDLSAITGAGGTIYFADDFEDGTVYRGSGNAHSGGGYWNYLGGAPAGTPYTSEPGDCGIVTSAWAASNHMTHISTDAAGQGAITGSTHALKTPYWSNCNNESSTRDITDLQFGGAKTEFYIRWYQKWTGNWMNGSVQHKLTKFISSDGLVGGLRFGANSSSWKTYAPNNIVDGTNLRWPGKTGISIGGTYYVWVAASGYSAGDTDEANDDDPSTTRTPFNTDQWYCIEMHLKMHTANNADGVYEAWVDGTKVFSLSNMVWGNAAEGGGDWTQNMAGVTNVELQHIYYNRATSDDQPTYIDNIVVADTYIGLAGAPSTITCYKDADGDLYSDGASEQVESCSANYYIAANLTATSGDCNDADPNINPGATEVCGNGIDEDCSGSDASCATITCYKDVDGDLYSDGSSEEVGSCSTNYYESGSLTATSGDCNDADANINPGATDTCGNGIDEDCSGTDEQCVGSYTTPITAGSTVITAGSTAIQ